MGTSSKHKVIIVGGGFGGVSAALELAKRPEHYDVTLISDKPHFEYHAALYRVVTGRSPLEVCIPLSTIFAGKDVKVIEDTITAVSPAAKTLTSQTGALYHYDSLILALGSEAAYFNIPGLKEHSFSLKSITDALKLKRHLHELFTAAALEKNEGHPTPIHLVLVGGGATGVELAGELAVYSQYLAKRHQIDRHRVIIDLFEASPRLVGMLDPTVSERCFNRLHQLGVNIFLDTPIQANKFQTVYLADIKMKTKTLIWTAGITTNALYAQIEGLMFNKIGRVLVDLYLQAKGVPDVYVVGDAAATEYSGLAQTALYDGRFVAESVIRRVAGLPPLTYAPKHPISALPVGPGYAVVVTTKFVVWGKVGWWIRRWADLKFFLSILPLPQAFIAFSDGYRLTETCPICSEDSKKSL